MLREFRQRRPARQRQSLSDDHIAGFRQRFQFAAMAQRVSQQADFFQLDIAGLQTRDGHLLMLADRARQLQAANGRPRAPLIDGFVGEEQRLHALSDVICRESARKIRRISFETIFERARLQPCRSSRNKNGGSRLHWRLGWSRASALH